MYKGIGDSGTIFKVGSSMLAQSKARTGNIKNDLNVKMKLFLHRLPK